MARLSYSPLLQLLSIDPDRSVATICVPCFNCPMLLRSNSSIVMEIEYGSCPDEQAADQMRKRWPGLALICSGNTLFLSTSKG
ncbi:hypothetical protein D3C80_1947780 [compost metagenome]